jgi:hypothetical protein
MIDETVVEFAAKLSGTVLPRGRAVGARFAQSLNHRKALVPASRSRLLARVANQPLFLTLFDSLWRSTTAYSRPIAQLLSAVPVS